MILSIIGLVALVVLSSYCFGFVAVGLTLEVPGFEGGKKIQPIVCLSILCGLSFFGALALLGSLLS